METTFGALVAGDQFTHGGVVYVKGTEGKARAKYHTAFRTFPPDTVVLRDTTLYLDRVST